jgi:hypothetical protein
MSIGEMINGAFEKYKLSECYKRSVRAMTETGMRQPYIDNIIRTAFDHAWWAAYEASPAMYRVKTKFHLDYLGRKKVIIFKNQKS